jgi:RNA polymerase sigma-70 factor (ECF subfamily)
MPTHLENESALIAEARAGNHEAFTLLVRQYDRHIYRLAMNIVQDAADAEDVLQEAFLKAYENLCRFQGDSRFYTWLVRITVNEALMKLRRRRSALALSLDDPVETGDNDLMPREIEDWGEDPERRFAEQELQGILAAAIEALELPYRTVFVLRDVEELSTEETAELLGISVPAVKSRLLRARLKMRQRMNRYFRTG